MPDNQQQFTNQELMTWLRKTFGEDICKLLVSGDMWETYDATIIFILNEMKNYLDVLGAFMKNGIFREANDIGIIYMKRSSCGMRKTNL